MKFTWERIEWKQLWFNIRFADHFPRYDFAKKYCKDKIVVDIASGTGYGSYELSKVAQKVIGIDIDGQSIESAQKTYSNSNLEYRLGNWQKIDLPDESTDVVISFETIEHIIDYHEFMNEIKRILKPWWVLVLSTPNYIWEISKNIYHVSNFTTIHLVDLFKKYYENFEIFYQWKHLFPFPWRGFLQVIWSWFGYKRDVIIRPKKPNFEHHVTLIVAKK